METSSASIQESQENEIQSSHGNGNNSLSQAQYPHDSQKIYHPPPSHEFAFNQNYQDARYHSPQQLSAAYATAHSQHFYNNYSQFPQYVPFYDQNGIDRQRYQAMRPNIGPNNFALQELNQNVLNTARSASNYSFTPTNLAESHRGSFSSDTMSSDDSTKNCSPNNSFEHHHSPVVPTVRISDIDTNPLNGPGIQTTNHSSQDSRKINKDSLESNYVYQILSRTWDGKLELRKQKCLEKMMKESEEEIEKKVVDVDNTESVDNAYEDSDSSDGSESEYDAYETEVTDELNKSLICSSVMQYEVDNHGYLPKKERLDWIASELCKVFIYEEKCAWLGTNKHGVMKGRFPNKLRKLRRAATKWGLWENPYQKIQQKRKAAPKTRPEYLDYFKKKNDLDGEARKRWTESEADRAEVFKISSLPAIITDFKVLCTPDGWKLCVENYNKYHSDDSADLLEKKWSKLANPILDYAKAQSKKPKNRESLKQLMIDNKVAGAESQEYIENLALLSLPHLLGSVTCTIVKGSKLSWRASAEEAQKSFILHIKEVSEDEREVEKEIATQKELYLKNRSSLNPYVIACGELENISHCYVVLHDYKYKFTGAKPLLQAVDTCFKVFSALHKRPPKPAEYAWQFLKKKTYDQEVSNVATAVPKLISALTTHKIKPHKTSIPRKPSKPSNTSRSRK